jgi:hypothetical protein
LKIEKLSVHTFWTSFLLAIQKSLTQEYYHYVSGIIKNKTKAKSILQKLDDYYRITDSKDERYRRYKDGYSVSIIHLLQMDDTLAFIIMTRINTIKGLFFEREKYADARDKKHRININQCYEFIRVNKESYDPKTNIKSMTNEVWTVDLTDKEKQSIIENFNDALIKRNYMKVRQICYGLHRLIGFSAVRNTYIELKNKIDAKFVKFQHSQDKIQYKSLDEIYKLPKKINYIKFMEVEYTNIKLFINNNK